MDFNMENCENCEFIAWQKKGEKSSNADIFKDCVCEE